MWSFGVTLWEILTLARQQPYEKFTDEGVIENLAHYHHNDGEQVSNPLHFSVVMLAELKQQ